jgi:hypothetical protein
MEITGISSGFRGMNKAKTPLRRTIRGGRHYFFADPAIDKLLAMLVTLASEVWAGRERLAALESIGVKRGMLGVGEVDAHEFDEAEEAALAAQRKEFIDSLFRVIAENRTRTETPEVRRVSAVRKSVRPQRAARVSIKKARVSAKNALAKKRRAR